MRRWFLLVAVMVLAGCTNMSKAPEVLVFTGESENWRVSYISSHLSGNEQETEYQIDYLGNDYPEEVSYRILTDIESGATGKVTLDEGDVIRGGGSCSGCATLRKDDVLQFGIEWNGQQETFDVKYDENAEGVME